VIIKAGLHARDRDLQDFLRPENGGVHERKDVLLAENEAQLWRLEATEVGLHVLDGLSDVVLSVAADQEELEVGHRDFQVAHGEGVAGDQELAPHLAVRGERYALFSLDVCHVFELAEVLADVELDVRDAGRAVRGFRDDGERLVVGGWGGEWLGEWHRAVGWEGGVAGFL
jgi:hypothetical protein